VAPPESAAQCNDGTAFRVVAGRYLGDLTANQEAPCTGDATALHQMRIALTRLRTAILFCSPMIDDAKFTQLRGELKWLNSHLGVVRDLDVAIERLKAVSKKQAQAISNYQSWNERRADSHRHLAQALQRTALTPTPARGT
jgi:CHAD domain-containing protein